MHDVFISHSSDDKQIADDVVYSLENAGIWCWIAPRDLRGVMNYSASIIDAIGNCSVLMLVLTDSANKSAPVSGEVEQAVRQGKPIIPFRVEDIDPSPEIMLHIGSIHWLDALTPPLESHFDSLTDSVSQFVERLTDPEDEAPLEPPLGPPPGPRDGTLPEPSVRKPKSASSPESVRRAMMLVTIIGSLVVAIAAYLVFTYDYDINKNTMPAPLIDTDQSSD